MAEAWLSGQAPKCSNPDAFSLWPQALRREIQVHKPRTEEALERAGSVASLRSPEVDSVRLLLERLSGLWGVLQEETEQRQQLLDATYQVEQYYFDVGEVEAWLSEQELFMMNEEKGKVSRARQRCLPSGSLPSLGAGVPRPGLLLQGAPTGREGRSAPGGCQGMERGVPTGWIAAPLPRSTGAPEQPLPLEPLGGQSCSAQELLCC